MAGIFQSTFGNHLKETIDTVVTDKNSGESDTTYRMVYEMDPMTDAYHDDSEIAGLGFAVETDEGQEVAWDTPTEGPIKRYIAVKYTKGVRITEEAIEDNKYKRVIAAPKMLDRAMWKTVDMVGCLPFVRATDTNYVGADGLPLASASHTLTRGGTFSNMLATPMSPSREALIVAQSQVLKYPGHDGITEGYDIKKVVCPTEQWAAWDVILNSSYAPEAGQFNAINSVNRSMSVGKKAVSLKFWDNTTTNWFGLTDADNGLKFRWRRRPRGNTWKENSNEIMMHSRSMRFDVGWTDARCIIFSNA